MTEITDNYAFIDGQNLHRGTIAEGWTINYCKLRVYLEEKYNVAKAFYFIGYRKDDELLYTHLRDEGYELIHKPTIIINGEYKGNCDAELVLHCMIQLNNFNKAVIISGDGDFYCLVKYLQELKKLRTVLIPNKNSFNKLLFSGSAGMVSYMNDLRYKVGI